MYVFIAMYCDKWTTINFETLGVWNIPNGCFIMNDFVAGPHWFYTPILHMQDVEIQVSPNNHTGGHHGRSPVNSPIHFLSSKLLLCSDYVQLVNS